MRLTRLRAELRSQRYGVAMGLVALLVAVGAPAEAFDGATSAASSVAKALKIAKRADKRSKRALRVAKSVSKKRGPEGPTGSRGPRGAQGPQGARGAQGPAGPPGSDAEFDGAAAGGALTGTYPNPLLAANSVATSQIADGQVTGGDLAAGSVRAPALGNRIAAASAGVVIQGGTGQNGAYNTAQQTVECPAGSKLLGGGGSWEPTPPANAELFIQRSLYAGFPTEQWIAVGGNDSGTDYTFKAYAICLAL